MTSEEYYIPPPDSVFEDIKSTAIKIWQTYNNEFGYVTEKVSRIEKIINIKDNAAYIVAMFDISNQNKLLKMVTLPETYQWLRELLEYSRNQY